MSILPLFAVAAFSFALAALLMRPLRAALAKTPLWSPPVADRWRSHTVPKTGGVVMAIAVAVVLAGAVDVTKILPLVLSAALMTAVGLIDDLVGLRPMTKLLQQIVVASILLYFASPVVTGWPAVDLLIGLLWIVGITNAINLLDNLDGLAAGVSLIAAASVTVSLALTGDPGLQPLAAAIAALAGALAGFLVFNFSPASVYMGDSGSHFIGAFLAGATLLAAPGFKSQIVPAAAIPVVILLIPIFDTVFVTLTRGLSGRSAFVGGRDHTSHRLAAIGLGERRAVGTLYLLAVLGGVCGLALQFLPPGAGWSLVGVYVTVLVSIGVYLGHVESSLDPDALAPLPSELTARFRIYEVALDAAVITLAYYVAFALRFRGDEYGHFLPYFQQSLSVVLIVQIATLWAAGKYRRAWDHFGPAEIGHTFKNAALATVATIISVLYLYRFQGYSRSVFIEDGVLLGIGMLGTRALLAGLDEHLRHRRSRGRNTLVYGAGLGGSLAVRELLETPSTGLVPVGYIDDDPAKRRMRIDGLRVRGSVHDLDAVLKAAGPGGITTLVIAIRELPAERFDLACRVAALHGVEVRRLRVDLDDVRWSETPAGILRFPR